VLHLIGMAAAKPPNILFILAGVYCIGGTRTSVTLDWDGSGQAAEYPLYSCR
jgi:hypothetical protein